MGEYTPNIKLYKPSIGETGWGDLVNNNFDVLDEQIDSIKKELITMAIKILMNQAVAHATSKDFYSIIADVITPGYPKGFKNTFEYVSSPAEYEITIDNSNNPNDLTDYQVLLEINNDEQFFEDCLYDQKFLEFYDEDKTTLLNHYVEEWDTENYNAKIWIKVPNIPANSTKKIYLKINTERTKDLSNGEAVFDFYDDFETLDTSKWADYSQSPTSVGVSEGILTIDNKQDNVKGILTIIEKTFNENIVIISKARLVSYYVDNANWFGLMALGDTPDAWVANTGSGYNALARANGNGQMLKDGSAIVGDTALDVDTAQWHKYAFVVSGNGVKLLVDDIEKLTYSESISRTGYVGLRTYGAKAEFDYIIIRKYTEPEPTVTYTRNVIPVDYVTVTFDFPEGVDKLLVTTDSDAQNVYYSTDDGNTWNPIERDTETELPDTAYSIKLKFEQATYMRGYAFLTW